MAISTTNITNISRQAIPILVNPVTNAAASANSSLEAAYAGQLSIPPGTTVTIETSRLDVGQLDQIRRKGLISYTST